MLLTNRRTNAEEIASIITGMHVRLIWIPRARKYQGESTIDKLRTDQRRRRPASPSQLAVE
jgi:hypothetical protein